MIDASNGTKTSAMIYSIAETAKANNLKPYEYFEYLLEEIPKHMKDTDGSFLDRLLQGQQNYRNISEKQSEFDISRNQRHVFVKVHAMERLLANNIYLCVM